VVFRADEGKLKAKTSMLVLHRQGDVEMVCARCGGGIILPLTQERGVALQKGEPSRRTEKREDGS
jgi:uncharacterized metal-binding protein YceD (DUF177 family)